MYLNSPVFGRHGPIEYTDGSLSREIEEEDERLEEERRRDYEGFGYKKPSITDLRVRIDNVTHLVDVCRSSLQSTDHDTEKVANVLFFSVVLELEEINKELARV